MPISSDQLKRYRRTARIHSQHEHERRERRREQAWKLAHQAAALLVQDYGVEHVAVFGSLTHHGRFTLQSDVDLAAWGLTSTNWLQASAAVRELSDEIDINLVDVATCTPVLLSAIERDGVSL